MRWTPLIPALMFVAALRTSHAEEAGAKIDFVRDVRPILEKHCFKCHGPTKQEGGVRWDRRSLVFAAADSGHTPVVPGDVGKSEAIKLVTAKAASDRMPREGEPLSAGQVATLKRWIEEGADWPASADAKDLAPPHWSFQPPRRPALPRVKETKWAKNAVDRFVLSRLERERLKPSPEADRETLIRRVYLDVVGLPPGVNEVEAFVADTRPDAYERMVDRLLDDPAYGERWAKMWLDLARFADSSGFGSDQLRADVWPFRDYVIHAFNRNDGFDRFTVEQIAGDLLPEATEEQRIASAFHRNTMTNVEGGTDDEEFRVAAVKDRANTTAQVWMGLTMGCAQCHTHKYDPITQREYYQFYAFFNQTEDFDQPDERPTMMVLSNEGREKLGSLQRQRQGLQGEYDKLLPQIAAAQAEWEKSQAGLGEAWSVLTPTSAVASSGATLTTQDDGSLLASGTVEVTDTYTVTATTDLTGVKLIRLETLTDDRLGNKGPGRHGNFVLSEFTVTAAPKGDATQAVKVELHNAAADFAQVDFPAAAAIDGNSDAASGWAVAPELGKPHTFTVQPKLPLGHKGGTTLTFTLVQSYTNHPIGRPKLSVSTHENPAAAPPSNIVAILTVPAEQRTPQQAAELATHHKSVTPIGRELAVQIAQVDAQVTAIQNAAPKIPVMRELAAEKRRVSRMMVKGNFLSPGEEVQPGTPAVFGTFPAGGTPDRLGVARWLLSPENPLTARVAVNRVWARLFGVGLVETEEDFGTQGAPPSHPELLDFLATEFVRTGWDMKRSLRLVVTSATYRQSSRVTPELLEKDARNRLLARGPRFRLSAETVRDQAMALSGLLSRKVGGRSVYPPQPDGLWNVAFNGQRNWATEMGEDRYRRGVYVFWRRTVPYPSMLAFDATTREICAIRRIRTNTPLQAFVTLNDPVYVETAQALARRIVTEGGPTTEDRVRFALELCVGRRPTEEQAHELVALYKTELEHYTANPSAATQLVEPPPPGVVAAPPGVTQPELAAWTVVANLLLNLDAVLMKG